MADQVLFNSLPLQDLRRLLLHAITDDNGKLATTLLKDERLDLQKSDGYDPLTETKSLEMAKIFSDYLANLKKQIANILLDTYPNLDYSKVATRQVVKLDEFCGYLSPAEPMCQTLPVKKNSREPIIPFNKNQVSTSTQAIHIKSNGIFVEMDWSNVVIMGEFLASALGQLGPVGPFDSKTKNQIFPRLVVYGSDEATDDKMMYLANYFKQFGAIYVESGHQLDIFLPKAKQFVQIVCTSLAPSEFVKSLYLGHSQMYYDGKAIWATIPALIACKYGLTIPNPDVINGLNCPEKDNKNIHQTVLMGFKIKYYPALEKYGIVTHDCVDIRSVEGDEEANFELNKISNMLETLRMWPPSKHIGLVKMIFGSGCVAVTETPLKYPAGFEKDPSEDIPELISTEEIKEPENSKSSVPNLLNPWPVINNWTEEFFKNIQMEIPFVSGDIKFIMGYMERTLGFYVGAKNNVFPWGNSGISILLSDMMCQKLNDFRKLLVSEINQRYRHLPSQIKEENIRLDISSGRIAVDVNINHTNRVNKQIDFGLITVKLRVVKFSAGYEIQFYAD
jgi:hypothetical protein